MSRKKVGDLKYKDTRGIVKILKVLHYRDHIIYIRSFYEFLFEYIVIHEGQVYSSYVVVAPEKPDQKKLKQQEVLSAVRIILTGAVATVDFLTGKELTPEEKKMAEEFIEAGNKIEAAKVIKSSELDGGPKLPEMPSGEAVPPVVQPEPVTTE